MNQNKKKFLLGGCFFHFCEYIENVFKNDIRYYATKFRLYFMLTIKCGLIR